MFLLEKATSIIAKEKLDESSKYNIFTASSPSNTIVVTPKSISGQLINDTFRTTNDLYEYSFSILKKATLLEFDRVYNETHQIETIYNEQLKDSVTSLFNGKNACCILFGPEESGKSYTLRGPNDPKSNEYGIFGRVIQDVLNLVELSKQTNLIQKKHKTGIYYAVKMSVYQVYLEQVNDLLSNQYNENLKIEKFYDDETNMMKTHISDLCEKEINSKTDYDDLMRQAVHNRRSLANYLKINDYKRKSHLVLSVIVEKREKVIDGYKRSAENTIGKYSQIDFVELASSTLGFNEASNSKSGSNIPDSTDFDDALFKSTSRTFNSICNNLVSASVGVIPKFDTKLTLSLKNTLNFHSNIVFLTCVLPSENPPSNSLKCLKFTNWLRNQILNLQLNQDYKIKTAYEESEEDTVQRDYKNPSDYNKRNNHEKYENSKSNLDSYNDFDNYYNYKRNQNKNFREDKTKDDIYELPQRFSTQGSTYVPENIGRSVNMNDVNKTDHQSLYDKYQPLDRERPSYQPRSPISRTNYSYAKPDQEKFDDFKYDEATIKRSRESIRPKYSKIKYHAPETSDSEYVEEKKPRSVNKSRKHTRSETNLFTEDITYPNIENEKKLHEVEKSLRDLEVKSLEMSRYIDNMKADKSRIVGMNDDSVGNAHFKTGCDCEVDKQKQEASILKSDNIIFREDINRLTEINLHIEEELARQRNRNLELAAENEKLNYDKAQLRCEIDKINENHSRIKSQENSLVDQLNHRFMTENRIRDLELENKNLREAKQNFEVDYKVLLERHTELKKINEQNENELNFIKIRQGEEVNNIENKLDKMAKEIEIQQRENSQLRLAEERMRQEISNLERQRENFREKYQDSKIKNNMLNTKLNEVHS